MRKNRSTIRKERMIMLASSVFVLTALTMTGFYVKEKNDAEKDGYVVDMSALEKKTGDKTKEIAQAVEKEAQESLVKGNDLDYDPNFQEASSVDVTGQWQQKEQEEDVSSVAEADEAGKSSAGSEEGEEAGAEDGGMKVASAEDGVGKPQESVYAAPRAEQAASEEQAAEEVSAKAAKALSFQEKEALSWPVAGNVLINYSMDKTVYFPTMQQYKYSPAIVIAASEGENITASADGRVLSVFEDPQIGQAVTVDIGNGYELTYGQLQDIMVLQGDVLSAGDVIGKVAAPTKYYSVEGPNLYFKMTRDGTAVNPLGSLE